MKNHEMEVELRGKKIPGAEELKNIPITKYLLKNGKLRVNPEDIKLQNGK